MAKNIIGVTIVIAVVALTLVLVFFVLDDQQNQAINSFDECVAAGYPVLESYPEQCKTPDGKSFTRDIGNELDKTDLIRITSPRPNQSVSGTVTVTGEARGSWYFEASFPVQLVNTQQKVIASSIATAEGEWMTEEFVPFKAELSVPASVSGKGTLILKKDNPSGLPEHDDELRVPVVLNK